MKLSIIVVTLNAGRELTATLKSIITQEYDDFEILIKDGGSTDGSLDNLPKDPRILLLSRPDAGIYDAMNQALEAASGDYVLFINCGDYLYDVYVLSDVVPLLNEPNSVVYGDILDRMAGARVTSNPNLDEFALYRNVPCHQACIYDRKMLLAHPFQTEYLVRADYEQFLWCHYIARAKMIYANRVISSYMGGGFSATRENRRLSAREHGEIVARYMSPENVSKYRRRMILSLSPLRRLLAGNPVTGGLYNRIKTKAYKT